jgi:hypothetical protein
MKVFLNPTGTNVHKGLLEVRLDIIPDEFDLTYQYHHVYMPVIPKKGYTGLVDATGNPLDKDDYKTWLEGLPHEWQTNHCLCHFTRIDETSTEDELREHIARILDKNTLATIDGTMVLPDSAHRLRGMNRKPKLNREFVKSKDITDLINSVNHRLKKLIDPIALDKNGGIAEIEKPHSIDVGAGATNRADSAGLEGATFIDLNNPANASGVLDTWEFWMAANAAGVEVATFYVVSETNFSTRDTETIGSVTSGSKQTFTGKSTNVTTGDYAGISGTGGAIERDSSGYSGCRYKVGDFIPCTNINFSGLYDGGAISIYATGSEPPIDVSLSGSLTPTGAVNRTTKKGLSGSITPTGVITTIYRQFKALAGSLTPTGALGIYIRSTKALAGSLTFTGSLGIKTKKGLSGAVSFTGALGRKIGKALAGSLTPTGALTTIYRRFVSLSGSITPTGALTTIYRRFVSLSGSLNSTGALALKIKKGLSGALTPTGVVSTVYRRFVSLSGSLTPTGVVTTIYRQFKSLSGSISFTGALLLKIKKGLSGSLTPTGVVTAIYRQVKSVAGSLTPTGVLGRKIFTSLAGSLNLTGVVGRKTKISLSGSITPIGTLALKIKKALAGAISFIGTLVGIKKPYLNITVYFPDDEQTVYFGGE